MPTLVVPFSVPFLILSVKKYWQLRPHINGCKSCRLWFSLMFNHIMAQLEYPFLYYYTVIPFAFYCWWNLEQRPQWVTPKAIWSLITSITRHNRFKFFGSFHPLQLDCCDESPGLPSLGSQMCNCVCHCTDGLHKTSHHIDTQTLKAEIKDPRLFSHMLHTQHITLYKYSTEQLLPNLLGITEESSDKFHCMKSLLQTHFLQDASSWTSRPRHSDKCPECNTPEDIHYCYCHKTPQNTMFFGPTH
jgi:hypothetical protein